MAAAAGGAGQGELADQRAGAAALFVTTPRRAGARARACAFPRARSRATTRSVALGGRCARMGGLRRRRDGPTPSLPPARRDGRVPCPWFRWWRSVCVWGGGGCSASVLLRDGAGGRDCTNTPHEFSSRRGLDNASKRCFVTLQRSSQTNKKITGWRTGQVSRLEEEARAAEKGLAELHAADAADAARFQGERAKVGRRAPRVVCIAGGWIGGRVGGSVGGFNLRDKRGRTREAKENCLQIGSLRCGLSCWPPPPLPSPPTPPHPTPPHPTPPQRVSWSCWPSPSVCRMERCVA